MSNTKRKDYYVDTYGSPLSEKKWKATSDKKKWYKPSSKAKEWLQKERPGKKVKLRRAMQKVDEDNEIILPIDKKTDSWNWN
jgi:hypothetical protein